MSDAVGCWICCKTRHVKFLEEGQTFHSLASLSSPNDAKSFRFRVVWPFCPELVWWFRWPADSSKLYSPRDDGVGEKVICWGGGGVSSAGEQKQRLSIAAFDPSTFNQFLTHHFMKQHVSILCQLHIPRTRNQPVKIRWCNKICEWRNDGEEVTTRLDRYLRTRRCVRVRACVRVTVSEIPTFVPETSACEIKCPGREGGGTLSFLRQKYFCCENVAMMKVKNHHHHPFSAPYEADSKSLAVMFSSTRHSGKHLVANGSAKIATEQQNNRHRPSDFGIGLVLVVHRSLTHTHAHTV